MINENRQIINTRIGLPGSLLDTLQAVKYNSIEKRFLSLFSWHESIRADGVSMQSADDLPATEAQMSCNTMITPSICRSWLLFTFIACICSCAQHRTAETLPVAQQAPQSAVEKKLEQARSDLAASKATEARIASELNALKGSGNANPDDLKNYETYLSRVQAMVAEQQKMVEEMEKARAAHRGAEKIGGGSQATPPSGAPAASMAPEKESGELGSLDRSLSDSLSEFDQMLLKEMDEIRAKSESRMSTLAQEAASAAGKIGEGGEEAGPSAAEGGSEAGAEAGGEKGSDEARQGESGGSYENVPTTDGPVAGGSSAGGPASGQQAGRPAGSDQDDDIVARQLREAAEKETDPELKKKLWKEYEDYKKASRQ